MSIRKEGGFALLDLVFVCGMIGLLTSIAVPNLILAKQAAGSASALGTLRTVGSSQLTFALTCGSGFYSPNLTTLGKPPAGTDEAFISPGMGDADTFNKSGYSFHLEGTPYPGAPPACNDTPGGGQGFKASAEPLDATNVRFFATNANMIIYEDAVTLWDVMPEVGEPTIGVPIH